MLPVHLHADIPEPVRHSIEALAYWRVPAWQLLARATLRGMALLVAVFAVLITLPLMSTPFWPGPILLGAAAVAILWSLGRETHEALVARRLRAAALAHGYCGDCGLRLETDDAALLKAERCPRCGIAFEPLCLACDYPLMRLPPDMQRCPECGAAIRHGDASTYSHSPEPGLSRL